MTETEKRNEAYKELSVGAFESGLQKLGDLAQWHDDSENLNGPFFLGFPGVNGWGEGLLVASLLKRYAVANKTRIRVFAQPQVCSILRHDAAFELHVVKNFEEGRSHGARSPMAILKAALIGNLLQSQFVTIETGTALRPTIQLDPRIGVAWASVSNGKPISAKTIPFQDFLTIFGDGNNNYHVVSLQRHMSDSERKILTERFNDRFSIVSTDLLDKENDQSQVVSEIRGLDCMITISTTTAHIGACLGVPVILLAARRGGPQWFWCAQLDHGKRLYDSMTVILGDKEDNWWESCVPVAQRRLMAIPFSSN